MDTTEVLVFRWVRRQVERVYIAFMRAVGRVLARVGWFAPDAPDRSHRYRHWLHSLVAIHDSRAMVRLDVPWWTYMASAEVEAWLASRERPTRVFEWGSGASTIWLARRADQVRSIEHDPTFHEHMRPMFDTYAEIDSRLVEPKPDRSPAVGSRKRGFAGLDFSAYVASIDETRDAYDLVVIDGRAREACLQAAVPRLASDGLIVFDNSRRRRYRKAIAAAALSEQLFGGLTPSLPYPDQTSLLRIKDHHTEPAKDSR